MAVAVHLLDPAVSATPIAPSESEINEAETKEEPQGGQDTGANVSQIRDNLGCWDIFTYWLFGIRTDDINDNFSRSNYSSGQGRWFVGLPWVLPKPVVALLDKGEHPHERVGH